MPPEPRRGKKVGIHHAEPDPIELMGIHKDEDLVMGGDGGPRQTGQRVQNLPTSAQASERQLFNDRRMGADLSVVKQRKELGLRSVKVVDPY